MVEWLKKKKRRKKSQVRSLLLKKINKLTINIFRLKKYSMENVFRQIGNEVDINFWTKPMLSKP